MQRLVAMFGPQGMTSIGVNKEGDRFDIHGESDVDDLSEVLKVDRNVRRQFEDCLLIDTRPALDALSALLAGEVPLLDLRLADAELSTVMAMAGLESGLERSVSGSVDRAVGPLGYAVWWRENGARIGRIIGGHLEWEETEA